MFCLFKECSQKNVAVSSLSCVSNNIEPNNDDDDDDDLLLMKVCEDYKKSVSNIHLGGIFQGASLQNVSINININK